MMREPIKPLGDYMHGAKPRPKGSTDTAPPPNAPKPIGGGRRKPLVPTRPR